MKEYKLGKNTYYQIENYMECSYTRWHEVQSHLVFGQWGYQAGQLAEKIAGFRKGFNESSMHDCAIFLHEAEKAAINIEENYDPWEYIFALLVLNKEEKQDEEDGKASKKFTEMTYLKEKIEKFESEGLKPLHTAEIIAFFFSNSRQSLKLDSLKVLQQLVGYLATMSTLSNST